MYSRVKTCVLLGLQGYDVDVETDLANGLPAFQIVGLPDTSIKESKERVRSALTNSGFQFPFHRITVNLAPANLKKEGSQLDMPIAVSLLTSTGVIETESDDRTAYIGEVSLDGRFVGVEGALPIVISLREMGFHTCYVPFSNREECGVVDGIRILPVETLQQLVDDRNRKAPIAEYRSDNQAFIHKTSSNSLDFNEVKGQYALKRALEVAAAGHHNILIVGSPGGGKTMGARRLPTILPEMTFDEAIAVTKIYSVAGELNGSGLMTERPFRAPHHTASQSAIIGGGRIPKPGEVSLAHHGVLFLDEFPEFSKSVIEVLRQPMEDGLVSISRVLANLSYPSRFLLVAAMNPCPCGYHGDPNHECTCTPGEISRYVGKISNPILDRIDIHIKVKPIQYDDLTKKEECESSAQIRERVNQARKRQIERLAPYNITNNSEMSNRVIKQAMYITQSAEQIMEQAFKKFRFSARSYHKLLKLSRTIADLDASETVEDRHVLEAIRFRSVDIK